MKVLFEPYTKLWDDDEYWAHRGMRLPRVGSCTLNSMLNAPGCSPQYVV